MLALVGFGTGAACYTWFGVDLAVTSPFKEWEVEADSSLLALFKSMAPLLIWLTLPVSLIGETIFISGMTISVFFLWIRDVICSISLFP